MKIAQAGLVLPDHVGNYCDSFVVYLGKGIALVLIFSAIPLKISKS
jgi:hypothetical protein